MAPLPSSPGPPYCCSSQNPPAPPLLLLRLRGGGWFCPRREGGPRERENGIKPYICARRQGHKLDEWMNG